MTNDGLKKLVFTAFFLIFTTSSLINGRIILHSQPSINPNYSSMELINAVNTLRVSNGLPPYQVNQTLMQIAQTHTDYQSSIGTTTHYGPDGSRPFQRALSAGYSVAGDINLGGFFSENITAGRNLSATEAVNSWKLDAPHLNTMLSSTLRDIGAGVTIVGEIVYYTIDVGLSTTTETISTQAGGVVPTYNPVVIKKIITSTPGLDGSIYHIVEIGETIWEISQIYKIAPEKLVQLNSLADSFIYVGDRLIIQLPFTPTPTVPSSTPTQFVSKTPSRIPSTGPHITATKTLPSTGTSINQPVSKNIPLLIIVILTLIASGLITMYGKKNNR
jgi:uncharacterized protein YkwD